MGCKSILVIEDDEDILDILKTFLEIEGYKVKTALNGRIGLELLPQMEKPCLILLDLMMPVMDGWAFTEALEQDVVLACIPVVVVTAFSEKATSIKLARSIIKKPVDIDVLLRIVEQYCGERVSESE